MVNMKVPGSPQFPIFLSAVKNATASEHTYLEFFEKRKTKIKGSLSHQEQNDGANYLSDTVKKFTEFSKLSEDGPGNM
jgi:hypothetical protein